MTNKSSPRDPLRDERTQRWLDQERLLKALIADACDHYVGDNPLLREELLAAFGAMAADRCVIQRGAGRRHLKFGVVELHSNPKLREEFYRLTGLHSWIVDVWMMDLANLLGRHGYEMVIYRGDASQDTI